MPDSFEVHVRQEGLVWVFETHGYINNLGGEAIADEFHKTFEKGGKLYLFDLKDSKIINSIGVSVIIEILEKILEREGTLAFCNCVPIVKKTFTIMGLTQYAKIYDSCEDGLAQFV